MTLVLLLGLLLIILLLINKNKLMSLIGTDNRFVRRLSNTSWFQNPWLSGFFLFLINAVLFGTTLLVLFGISYLMIPFIHLFIMLGAVLLSLYVWMIFQKASNNEKREKLVRGFIGSSFYLLPVILFTYWMITLEPQFPGDDTFMAFIGLVMGIFVTSVAFFTCFIITGVISRKS